MEIDNPDANLPGDVVLARVLNPLENRHSVGKARPVVLVSRVDGHWRAMGLTTKPTYSDGKPRTRVPNPGAVGLRGPGYLWGDSLTNISALDIHHRIGVIDASLSLAIIKQADLSPKEAYAFLSACLDIAA